MPQPLVIRRAQRADAPAMGNLAAQFAEYLRHLGDYTDFQLTAAALLRDGFGDEPAFEGLVAESEGRVVGYLLYHMGYDSDRAQRTLHVADLYVDATARRHGIGRALMEQAANLAKTRGAGEMIWSVFRANDLAASFYEQLGAQKVTDVYFMTLKLAPR